MLLSRGTKKEMDSCFRLCALRGDVEIAKLLMERGADPSASENWALGMASWNGHAKLVELLLKDARVDPAARDIDPVILAAENGHCEVLKLLLADPRVDPAARDDLCVSLAAQKVSKSVAFFVK